MIVRRSERCFSHSNLRVLFVALVDNIGCERVIGEMSRHGSICALLSPPGYHCTMVQSLSRHFRLPRLPSVWLTSLLVSRKLEEIARDWKPALIVPLDDVGAWLLRSLANGPGITQELRELLVVSFGSPAGYQAATSRAPFMEVASKVGVRKPLHRQIVGTADELDVEAEWQFPLFLKVNHTCGGVGVAAVNDAVELRHELSSRHPRRLRSRVKSAAKRILGYLAGFIGGTDEELLLQSFAPGIPAFRTVVAWNGRVLAGASFAAERIHPEPTGASTVVRFLENREMEETVAAMTAALGCSGFLSFDFMLDEERGHATLIEMNPRIVGSCHLGSLFGHDLCGALVAKLTGASAPGDKRISKPKLIALFPKELQRDCDSAYLQSPEVWHDVPSGEINLVTSYMGLLKKLYPAQINSIRQIVEKSLGQSL
jgi:hypothetical protein